MINVGSAWEKAKEFTDRLQPLNAAAGGTSSAEWYLDDAGKRWVVKRYADDKQRASYELCANEVYMTCGVPVPLMMPVLFDNEYGVASLEVYGSHPKKNLAKCLSQDASDGFLVDCLLRNWDVVGQQKDNIIVANGTGQHAENKLPTRQSLVRIDFGGCFESRAGGGPKEPATGEVKETKTLLAHQGSWLYSHGLDTDSAPLPTEKQLLVAMERYGLPATAQRMYSDRLAWLLSNFKAVLLRDAFDDHALEKADWHVKGWAEKIQSDADAIKKKVATLEAIARKKSALGDEFFENETMPLQKSAREARAFVNTCRSAVAEVRRELADIDGDIYFISTGRKLWSQHVSFSVLDDEFEAGLETARSWLIQQLEQCSDSKLKPAEGGDAVKFRHFAKLCGLDASAASGAEKMVSQWAGSSNSLGATLMKAGLHGLIGNPIEMEAGLPFVGGAYMHGLGCGSPDALAESVAANAKSYLGDAAKLSHAVKAIAMFNQTWVEYLILKRPGLVTGLVSDGMVSLARGMSGKSVSKEFRALLQKSNVRQSFEAVASVASSFSTKESVAKRFGNDVFLAFEVDVSNILVSSWAMGSWLYGGEHETVVICPNCMYSFRDDQVMLK